MTNGLFNSIFVGLISLGFFSGHFEKNPSNKFDIGFGRLQNDSARVGNDARNTSEGTHSEVVKGRTFSGKVFDVVEQQPSFPGGMRALNRWLCDNIKYPPEAVESRIEGRVTVQFVVERDGSISDAKVMKSVEPSLDKEAIRVVGKMPKWIPGKQDGQAVRVKFFVPVTFRLQ